MNVSTFTPTQIDAVKPRVSLSASNNRVVKLFSFLKKNFKPILFIVVGIFAMIGVYNIFFKGSSVINSQVLPIKQNFQIVALTKDGKLTNGNLKIDVTGAYKSASLLIQGQRVTARNGKVFLIVNLDMTNPYKVPLYNYPVDSFRLITLDGKKIAPTAHQGNVEIRPESTKTSNVGFIITKETTKFKVEVGSLDGEKTVLEFTLK